MDRAEYDKLDRTEERMWWFAAVHANLLGLYRQLRPAPAAAGAVLDAGCGTGGLLAKIAAGIPTRFVIGLDADHYACIRARAKSARPVSAGTVNALPFADASLAAIFSADVLCHDGVDESMALAQFHRCLGRDGVLLLNLPAYPWLLSRHDVAVANVRRYTRRRVALLLRQAGFRLLFASYWNTFLFPVMVVTRKLLPDRLGSSDVKLYPPAIDAFCRGLTGFEAALLRRQIRLPFGGSLLAVAAKEENAHA